MIPLCLRKEFVLKNFLYEYPNERAFYCCQWNWPRPLYVIIRLVLACYSVYAIVHHVVYTRFQPHIFLFFTTWSYIVLVLHLVCAAAISIMHCRRPAVDSGAYLEMQTQINNIEVSQANRTLVEDVEYAHDIAGKALLEHPQANSLDNPERDCESNLTAFVHGHSDSPEGTADKLNKDMEDARPSDEFQSTDETFKNAPSVNIKTTSTKWYLKLSWCLSNVASIAAPIVTVIFYTVMYSLNSMFNIQNTNLHILNLVFVIIDHLISARPVRVLHVSAPLLYFLSYMIFTIIYWSTDKQNHVIYYSILNWNAPVPAIILIFGLIGVIPLLQFVFFGVYQLRKIIHVKIYGVSFDTYLLPLS